jgi:hypothetical protein
MKEVDSISSQAKGFIDADDETALSSKHDMGGCGGCDAP